MADVTISGLGDLTPTGGLLLPVSDNSTTGKVTIDGAINTIGSRTSSLNLPVGTTAQRPITPTNGTIRFNTTTGSLEVYYASNWLSISTSTLIAAGGDTTITSGGYKYHVFTSVGSQNFTVTAGSNTVEYLVVAGGGGGTPSGGGGAGGVLGGATVIAPGVYTVTVGAGGTYGNSATNGGNSSFGANVIAFGGGRGGYTPSFNGSNGGSGGGAGTPGSGTVTYTGGNGTTGQGNNGGGSATATSAYVVGGGGGGAGGAGQTYPNRANGGIGTADYSIWGAATNTGQNVNGVRYFAGGGGGYGAENPGGFGPGSGGSGGGGSGSGNYNGGTAGTANTGGGGGSNASGGGGSGIVIIRYVA